LGDDRVRTGTLRLLAVDHLPRVKDAELFDEIVGQVLLISIGEAIGTDSQPAFRVELGARQTEDSPRLTAQLRLVAQLVEIRSASKSSEIPEQEQ
jgi:hypothetical protein